MTNAQTLDEAVRLALGLPGDAELDGTGYGRTDGWDSVGHTELMTALEAAFDIEIEADDVFEMSDYAAVRRVLGLRYHVDLGG